MLDIESKLQNRSDAFIFSYFIVGNCVKSMIDIHLQLRDIVGFQIMALHNGTPQKINGTCAGNEVRNELDSL